MSADRIHLLHRLLGERILILDGAMGTMIQSHGLDAHHYHGDRFHDHACDQKGNNDLLTLTQPQIIRGIHAAYLEAGADILETNTFNSTRIAMADYGMEDAVHELNRAGARTGACGGGRVHRAHAGAAALRRRRARARPIAPPRSRRT